MILQFYWLLVYPLDTIFWRRWVWCCISIHMLCIAQHHDVMVYTMYMHVYVQMFEQIFGRRGVNTCTEKE